MSQTARSLLKSVQVLMLAMLLQILPGLNAAATAAVVSGDFVYEQEGDGSLVQYQVNKMDYQGTPAWEISWHCEKMQATHYVRRSDGRPLYVKRVNHALKRTIEISYSQHDDKPTIYRKRSENELVERKIWHTQLHDLGTLPQLLLSVVQANSDIDHSDSVQQEIHFSAINYDDGKVYKLVAKQSGFRHVRAEGKSVRCAIYDVKLDSWLSTFVAKTRLLIPMQQDSSNFVAYSGPGLDGVADAWSLRLVGRGSSLAMAEAALAVQ